MVSISGNRIGCHHSLVIEELPIGLLCELLLVPQIVDRVHSFSLEHVHFSHKFLFVLHISYSFLGPLSLFIQLHDSSSQLCLLVLFGLVVHDSLHHLSLSIVTHRT